MIQGGLPGSGLRRDGQTFFDILFAVGEAHTEPTQQIGGFLGQRGGGAAEDHHQTADQFLALCCLDGGEKNGIFHEVGGLRQEQRIPRGADGGGKKRRCRIGTFPANPGGYI